MALPVVSASNTFSAAMVLKRHPFYEQRLKHWLFCEATYYGGREWFKGNIHKYLKEGESEYSDRVNRAYRFNHTREVVDLVSKYIFRGEILRDDSAPETVKRFWKHATKTKQPIHDFMNEASIYASIYGMPWAIVDQTRPSEGEAVITLADQERAALRPYVYLVKPQNVLDLSWDDNGELNWILIKDTERADADWSATTFITYDVWRVWTRTHWYKLEAESPKGKRIATLTDITKSDKIRVVDSGEHGLGVVPAVPITDRGGSSAFDDYAAPGLIDDIAYLDRAAANYLSNLDAIIQDQTFSQLVIPAQALSAGDEAYDQLIKLGTKRILAYDAEGGQKGPEYISPDPTQAGVILQVITKIITEIYHSAGVAGERTKMDNAVGIDNSSGVAKAYDFDRINAMLATKAERLERAENQIIRLVQMWQGETPTDEDYVTYPREFDTMGVYDEFDIASRLFAFEAPNELRRHQIMKMVDKLYPQLSVDLRNKIEADVKEWPENRMPEVQKASSGEQPSRSRQGQVTSETL